MKIAHVRIGIEWHVPARHGDCGRHGQTGICVGHQTADAPVTRRQVGDHACPVVLPKSGQRGGARPFDVADLPRQVHAAHPVVAPVLEPAKQRIPVVAVGDAMLEVRTVPHRRIGHRVSLGKVDEHVVVGAGGIHARGECGTVPGIVHHQGAAVKIGGHHRAAIAEEGHHSPRFRFATCRRVVRITDPVRKVPVDVHAVGVVAGSQGVAVGVEQGEDIDLRLVNQLGDGGIHTVLVDQVADEIDEHFRAHGLVPVDGGDVAKLRLVLLGGRVIGNLQHPQLPVLD